LSFGLYLTCMTLCFAPKFYDIVLWPQFYDSVCLGSRFTTVFHPYGLRQKAYDLLIVWFGYKYSFQLQR
jgi:hypothetical protein